MGVEEEELTFYTCMHAAIKQIVKSLLLNFALKHKRDSCTSFLQEWF
jgi:hypothetical protein